jgi:hypothetical protein
MLITSTILAAQPAVVNIVHDPRLVGDVVK